ncbi:MULTISPECIES: sulfotransferase family protein [Rhodococcus]|uniref:sulfotransferase family protein n=1 Tax=Rhodococcus TaxID=1827 RepID=UPI0007AEAF13|nr:MULTISPECIES: sulfotransferase [Rhodococcus]KZL34402.1 sulfotransferase [Rhodococcus qingshengii]MBQ9054117.1 sulfotransferase [Rhodococcus sp. (in: high G+C Gram-positive bacteria)]MCE4164019.1 sulfotransferase [Rhodococcus sp. Ni2]
MTQDYDGIGSIDHLHQAAREAAGYENFGSEGYLEGLRVLLESFQNEADLTPHGKVIARKMIVGALAGRLTSEAGFAKYPEHVDVPIERPIFVVGLTRTGSTALHRLLGADPAHQGAEMWLAETPQPRPERDTWSENEDYVRSDAFYRARQRNEADLMKVHFMGAEEVEECWRLLQQTMLSTAFETVAYVPSYTRWLAEQDWTETYARHKKNLQLIGLHDQDRRWVLKSPSHVFAIDEIMSVYPDALFVRTFRDPLTSMASTFSLVEQGGHDMSRAFDRPAIGRTQLELWARGNANLNNARSRYNPDQFIDVDYKDFIADAVGTVEKIYAQFALPFTDDARAAVEASHQASLAEHRRPSHRYSLEDFGVSAADVEAKFATTP